MFYKLVLKKKIWTDKVGVDYSGLKAAHSHFAQTGLMKGQPKETELCVEVNNYHIPRLQRRQSSNLTTLLSLLLNIFSIFFVFKTTFSF